MNTTELSAGANTPERILDIAEGLVQRRGYNGFSYADIAREMSIAKASLHYHYAGKAELGEALIERYTVRFGEALEAIDASLEEAGAKLAAYADLYSDVLRGDRMCLCGMLAAEYETLPDPMSDSVRRFFDLNVAWLARVLADGASAGTLSLEASPVEAAQGLLGALQGAMLVARPYRDPQVFQAVAAQALGGIAVAST
ncbi:MAG: TetR/AcrR family transcriptional regulator, transcriptional repressor for nem operon [Solirubrobacteraceae bacterium]|jgi:TetR/AcrR family transcriptional repressor of nem operon|nr:regulatory protein TetR [Solirubrobacterales bacterium]MEA2216455.1 TetR/AcrR family transcriptional regulator, transcriptional repressor for nem operon [Solirubrobacteraceae bacterium]